MADSPLKLEKIKKRTKKEIRNEVSTRLSAALEDYKNKLGDKKFTSNIKRASKLFAVDLIKAFRKKAKAINKKKHAK